MTDREKVIKGLECCATNRIRREDCEAMNCTYLDLEGRGCIHQLIRDTIALLKAQEPRTVLSIFKAHEGTFGNCSTCGAELMDYYNEKHCGRCGQAVKWE